MSTAALTTSDAATPTAIGAANEVGVLNKATFDQMWRVAKAMAMSSLCPKHLQGRGENAFDETIGNCIRVCNQALRWGMDPFAVADESYVVGGKLGYQGKLVAAVVNARAGLRQRLAFSFKGSGDDLTVTVSGHFKGDDKPKELSLSVGQAKTANDMWKKDPEQKLCYSGAIKWARRYCPELILGVLTDDDLERIAESTPRDTPRLVAPQSLDALSDRLEGKDADEPADDRSKLNDELDKTAEKSTAKGKAKPAKPEPASDEPTPEEAAALERQAAREGGTDGALFDTSPNYD